MAAQSKYVRTWLIDVMQNVCACRFPCRTSLHNLNFRASATPQHKNPHPATSMTVLRAPHQTTASASLAKFSNRSKPCCQPVKAMLPENRIGSKCQLLEMLTRLLQSYFHVFAEISKKTPAADF